MLDKGNNLHLFNSSLWFGQHFRTLKILKCTNYNRLLNQKLHNFETKRKLEQNGLWLAGQVGFFNSYAFR